ncbi:MAG: hypothetical protein GKR96_01315 [Gammaproteobacteria bacterium]|nr:hypothetical protein [Gammaproteobacteria bacterium]
MLHILGIRCELSGDEFSAGSLLVSNHVSWADICLIGSAFPVTFLAGSKIGKWPVLGWLMNKAGTLFIDRGRGAERASREVANLLATGNSVAIFPEGRTSDGKSVGKFHARLYQAATAANKNVQAVGIRYEDKLGNRVADVRWIVQPYVCNFGLV